VKIRELGIEEEFLLFRADAALLADVGPHVVAAAERAADDEAQFEKELKAAQAELATRPGADLDAVARELAERRGELVAAAAARDVRVVAAGTSPVGDRSDTTRDARYAVMAATFGAVERRQLTCAMHVHVGVDSDDEGVRVLNGIAPWLPVLTALSANSPYHRGHDTGYASFRRVQWGQWPTAGPTGRFDSAREYHDTVRDLIATGAAHDDGMIYFDARLSAKYPTVEIRVCDVATDLGIAAALAALCRGLVATVAGTEAPAPVRLELLRAAHWRAARYGLGGELVDPTHGRRLVPAEDAVAALLEVTEKALDAAGDTDRVRDVLDALRKDGTGADRQRAAVAAAGGDVAAAVDVATLRG
jgi:carboxylate-amine ligase